MAIDRAISFVRNVVLLNSNDILSAERIESWILLLIFFIFWQIFKVCLAMRGHVQQTTNVSQYDRNGGGFSGSHTGGGAADAAMTRWLQSAGLQHLASPSIDPRHFPNSIPQVIAHSNLHTLLYSYQLWRSLSIYFEVISYIFSFLRPLCVKLRSFCLVQSKRGRSLHLV